MLIHTKLSAYEYVFKCAYNFILKYVGKYIEFFFLMNKFQDFIHILLSYIIDIL